MTVLGLGDWVLLDDGREAQVTEHPDRDVFTIRVWAEDGTSADVRPQSVKLLRRSLPGTQDGAHTAKLVTATRTHQCAGRAGIVKHFIRRGDVYVLTKVFPGHESGAAGDKGEVGSAPRSKKLCTFCAGHYVDTDPARLAAES